MLAELKEWVAYWEKRPAQSHPVSLLHGMSSACWWRSISKCQAAPVHWLHTASWGTADAERSFSAFHRINTYLQSRMSQDRLLGLALMHVHHGLHVDTKEICQKYIQANSRRMFQSSIIRQSLDRWVCLTSDCTVLMNLPLRGKLVTTVQPQDTVHSLWHYIMFHVFTRQLKFHVTFSFPCCNLYPKFHWTVNFCIFFQLIGLY